MLWLEGIDLLPRLAHHLICLGLINKVDTIKQEPLAPIALSADASQRLLSCPLT